MRKISFLTILAVFFIFSCKKANEDVTPPSIQIVQPTAGSQWAQSDSVQIEVKIHDEDLHEYHIRILQEGATAFEFKTHTHEQQVVYQRAWYPDNLGSYTLSVDASDHNGNANTASAIFSVE